MNQLFPSYNKSRKIIEFEANPSEVIPLTSRDWKVVDAEFCKSAMNTSRSRKIIDLEFHIIDTMNTSRDQKVVNVESYVKSAIKKSRIGQIIKSSAKVKDIIRISGE